MCIPKDSKDLLVKAPLPGNSQTKNLSKNFALLMDIFPTALMKRLSFRSHSEASSSDKACWKTLFKRIKICLKVLKKVVLNKRLKEERAYDKRTVFSPKFKVSVTFEG